MRRWLGWAAIGWLLAACALALALYGGGSTAATLDARTAALAQQLRCPVCQGESVADSPSGIAKSMRGVIRRRLEQGQSPDQIKSYLVSAYGRWILLSPPASGLGTLAWLGPPLLIAGGLGLLLALVTDWRRRGRLPEGDARSAYLRRVREELAADSVE